MKQKYKIQIGEWVNVYSTQTLVVETDKDLENMTTEQVVDLLEQDENTQILDVCDSDYDWTTEDHEEWDRYGKTTILDKQEAKNE